MARERDNQRQKVYDAEQRATGWHYAPASTLMTIEQCQAFVDRVLATKWLANQEDMRMQLSLIRRKGGVIVFAGSGTNASIDDRIGTSYGWAVKTTDRPSISMARQSRQKMVLLHELSHLLQPSGSAAHGWQFCSIELRLVRHFLGKEAYDKLKAEFKAGRVRFTKPRAKRELTPEQRAVLVERMAVARAAKAASKVA